MPVLTNPADIIEHILRFEVQQDIEEGKIEEDEGEATASAVGDVDEYSMAFVVHNKQINSKKLIEGIASNTRLIPYIKNSKLTFRSIKKQLEVADITRNIDASDVISYNNSRTSPQKIYTKVIVNYNFDYALEDFQKSTIDNEYPDSIPDIINNAQGETPQPFQEFGNLDEATYLTNLGLSGEQLLTFDAEYIRDAVDVVSENQDLTAIRLQKFLLLFHCNQHNILKLKLPLKYITLQMGDYVAFDNMINDVKLFGEDYSLSSPNIIYRNGQQIYPIWMVTKTQKTLTHINVDLLQMHNCDASVTDYPPVALINGELDSNEQYEVHSPAEILLNGTAFDPNPDDEIVSYQWTQVSGDNVTIYDDDTDTLRVWNGDLGQWDDPHPITVNHRFSLVVTSSDGVVSEPAFINIQRIDDEAPDPPAPPDPPPPPPDPSDPNNLPPIDWLRVNVDNNSGEPYSFWDSYADGNEGTDFQRVTHMAIGSFGAGYNQEIYPDEFPFRVNFRATNKPEEWTVWEEEYGTHIGFRTQFFQGRHSQAKQIIFPWNAYSSHSGYGDWSHPSNWRPTTPNTGGSAWAYFWWNQLNLSTYIANRSASTETEGDTGYGQNNAIQFFDIADSHFFTDVRNRMADLSPDWIENSQDPMPESEAIDTSNRMLEISARCVAYARFANGTRILLPNLGYAELHIRSYPLPREGGPSIIEQDVALHGGTGDDTSSGVK